MSTLNAITSGAGGVALSGDTSGNLVLQSAGTTFATGNQYGIGLGTAVPSSGIGIAFPATQSASSDANTLDDYEEGVWTPTDGSGAGLTLSISSATYTKIGRIVTVTCYVTYPSTASASTAAINGLPFAEVGGNVYSTGVLSSNSAVIGNVRINNGSQSTVTLYITSNNTAITNAQISNNYIIFTITYPTT